MLPPRRQPQDRDDVPAGRAVTPRRAALRQQGLTVPLRRRRPLLVSPCRPARPSTPSVDPPRTSATCTSASSTRAGAPRPRRADHPRAALPGDTVRRSTDLHGAARPDVEVHVVLTARDWRRQLPAEWQQFVKTRHRADLRALPRRGCRDDPGRPGLAGPGLRRHPRALGRKLPPEPGPRRHGAAARHSARAAARAVLLGARGRPRATLDHGPPAGNPSLGFGEAPSSCGGST